MRKHLSLIFMVFACTGLLAQEDSPTTYGSFFGLAGSRYEPAVLGRDFKTLDVGIINAYVWAGNTTFSRAEIENMVNSEIPDLEDLFDRLKDKNRIGFGTTVDLLNIGYRHNQEAKVTSHGHQNRVWCPGDYYTEEVFSVFAGISERVEFNLTYAGDIYKLAYKGNKQFENQSADLFLYANAFHAREYTVGFAMPLKFHTDDFDFRIGARIKRIHSIAGTYSRKSDNSLFTAQGGQYLELKYDYQQDIAYDEANFSPFNMTGKGWGTDLGFTAHYKQRYYANVNMLDFGYIRYKSGTESYRKDGEVLWEGVVLNNVFQDEPEVSDTAITAIYEDNHFEGEAWTMPYPMRMRMHMAYRVPGKNKREELYHKHSFSVTYIQGFVDLGNAIKKPYFAGAYVFNLLDHFEVGTNVGLSGFNRTEIGAFLAARAGFFRIGVGSGNLSALMKNFGTGGDLNFNMTLSF